MRLDLPEPDGFSAREHLKGGDPENEKLRTFPPPPFAHLWFQYLDVASDRQPNMAGLESLTYSHLDHWANCRPVNRSPFKFEMLRLIDRKVRSVRQRFSDEQKRKDGREKFDAKAGHRHHERPGGA